MTDEVFYARRRKLEEAVKKAVLDLLAHENIAPAGFSFPLNDELMLTAGPNSLLDDVADGERVDEMERLKMNIGPGEAFGEEANWIASFTTDAPDAYVHVFAGETLREAVDKAIAGAAEL